MDIRIDLPGKDEYFHLFESTGWNEDYDLSKDEVYKTLKNSWYYVFAYSRDSLIGCVRVICDRHMHALILDMIVDENYRFMGVGSKLIENILQKCKEEKIRDVQLFSSKGSYEFYEKNGFERRPEDAPGMEIRLRY